MLRSNKSGMDLKSAVKEGGIRETVISRTAQARLSQQYSVLSEYSPFFSPHAALAAVALSQGAAHTTSH